MKSVEVNWNPTRRQLKQFGVICLAVLPFVAWMWGAAATTIGYFAAVGLVVAVLSFVFPAAAKWIFVALSLIAIPIGLVLGEVAMLVMYFGVFLPIGLIFRLMRRDALGHRRPPSAETYWQPKKQPSHVSSYYRQF